jgi:hypothetical protein
MSSRLAADALVVVHLAFIVFVLGGGLLVLWRGAFAIVHLPAVAWGAWTEFTGTICPLTPLENTLRRAAGEAGYTGGFIEHYMIPLIYPDGLTPRTQIALGIFVVGINAAVYVLVLRRSRRRRAPAQ